MVRYDSRIFVSKSALEVLTHFALFTALFMSTDNCEVPYVERKDYQLVDIGRDGYLALYDEGTPKHDLCLGSSKVDTELRAAFEEYVKGLSCLRVISLHTTTNG